MVHRRTSTGSNIRRTFTVRRRDQLKKDEPEKTQQLPPRIPSLSDLSTSFVAGSLLSTSTSSLPATTEPVKPRRFSRFYEALPDTKRAAAYTTSHSTPSSGPSQRMFQSSSQSLNFVSTPASTVAFNSTASLSRCDGLKEETIKGEEGGDSELDKATAAPQGLAGEDLCRDSTSNTARHGDTEEIKVSALTGGEDGGANSRRLRGIAKEGICTFKNAVKKRTRRTKYGTLPSSGP